MIKLKSLLDEASGEGNNLDRANSTYKVVTPFDLWIISGHQKSLGRGHLLRPDYKKVTAKKGDLIENLYGGLFWFPKSGPIKKRTPITAVGKKEPQWKGLEKGKNFVSFDMDKLKKIK